MIELIYSNKTENLLKNLALYLQVETVNGSNPLEPVEIVVPNRNMETWVRLGLAQVNGVAANLNFKWLESYIGGLVAKATAGKIQLVDTEKIEAAILAVLMDEEQLRENNFKPVRDYLSDTEYSSTITNISSGFDSFLGLDGKDIRRVQLAARMASLFQEYTFSRPEMIAHWLNEKEKVDSFYPPDYLFTNPGKIDPSYTQTIDWQKTLWQSIFGSGGVLENNPPAEGGEWITMDRLVHYEPFFKDLEKTRFLPVHIFGVSYMARIFQLLFARLSAIGTLRIYSLNPCAEFWEDVETEREYILRLDREKERRKKISSNGSALKEEDMEDPFGLFKADNPALRYWGRPGREHVRLLDELTDCDFHEEFANPLETGNGLLHHLQKDIMDRMPERTLENGTNTADGTINVVLAPSIRREVEWVADEIWNLVRNSNRSKESDPLRFNDIAVIINNAERDLYLPQVETVFAASHNLPNTISDLPGSSGSKLIEAMIMLLKLPFGRFSRTEMLAFMGHPAVTSRFDLIKPEEIAAKADKLGIAFGADRSDLEGTYIDEDVYNWNQGINRLALGAFMSGDKSGDTRIYETDSGKWLVEENRGSSGDAAVQFALLTRTLINDARFVRRAKMSLSQWADFFRGQVDRFFNAEEPGDASDRLRIFRTLSKLETADMEHSVSGRAAAEIAVKALQALPGGRGQYLAEGVAVSSFLPMRAIPFKVVFVLGLGEGLFPATGRRDALDLRSLGRRAGDVDPSERDRYMFLETILSTREKLYISYVKRDEQTGEPLQPSAIVQELLHMLRQGFLGEEETKKLFTELPLRRFDEPQVFDRTFLDEAVAEAQIKKLAVSLHDSIYSGTLDNINNLLPVLPVENRKLLEKMLNLPGEAPVVNETANRAGVLPAEEMPSDTPVSLTISNLNNFLSCPMQGWAATILGLAENEEDLAEREEEDFEFNRLTKTSLLREIFIHATANDLDLPAAYDQIIERLRLAGQVPVGILGQIFRDQHLLILQGWQTLLKDSCLPGPGNSKGENSPGRGKPCLKRIRFGHTGHHFTYGEIYDPIVLEPLSGPEGKQVGHLQFRISGTTETLTADNDSTVILLPRKAPAKSIGATLLKQLSRYLLRGIIDHLTLSAAGLAGNRMRQVILACADEEENRDLISLRLNPVDKEKAIIWLTHLAADLTGQTHAYLLPCEAIFTEIHGAVKKLPAEDRKSFRTENIIDTSTIQEAVRLMAANSWISFSSLWGPVPEPRTYNPPSTDRLAVIIKDRLTLIFDEVIEVEDFS